MSEFITLVHPIISEVLAWVFMLISVWNYLNKRVSRACYFVGIAIFYLLLGM